ncbi:MAG: hypothetical protein ABI658_09595 [Acidimicrobiales bacterium]
MVFDVQPVRPADAAVGAVKAGTDRPHVRQRLGLAEASQWTLGYDRLEKLRGFALVLNS